MSVQIEVTTDTEAIDVTTGNVTEVNVTDPSGYSQSDIEDIVNEMTIEEIDGGDAS